MVIIRSIRKTSYRLRARGRCIKQTMEQKERIEKGVVYIAMSKLMPSVHRMTQYMIFLAGIVNFATYNYYRNVVYRNKRWQGRSPPKFDKLDEFWCWSMLRFRKKHLWRISEALLLPAELCMDNGSWTTNEEMLIVLLLRLASTDGWLKLESVIQIEMSRLSRLFNKVVFTMC